jgi:hypothetical protein
MLALIDPDPAQEYNTKSEYKPDQDSDTDTFYQNAYDQSDHDGKDKSRLSPS